MGLLSALPPGKVRKAGREQQCGFIVYFSLLGIFVVYCFYTIATKLQEREDPPVNSSLTAERWEMPHIVFCEYEAVENIWLAYDIYTESFAEDIDATLPLFNNVYMNVTHDGCVVLLSGGIVPLETTRNDLNFKLAFANKYLDSQTNIKLNLELIYINPSVPGASFFDEDYPIKYSDHQWGTDYSIPVNNIDATWASTLILEKQVDTYLYDPTIRSYPTKIFSVEMINVNYSGLPFCFYTDHEVTQELSQDTNIWDDDFTGWSENWGDIWSFDDDAWSVIDDDWVPVYDDDYWSFDDGYWNWDDIGSYYYGTGSTYYGTGSTYYGTGSTYYGTGSTYYGTGSTYYGTTGSSTGSTYYYGTTSGTSGTSRRNLRSNEEKNEVKLTPYELGLEKGIPIERKKLSFHDSKKLWNNALKKAHMEETEIQDRRLAEDCNNYFFVLDWKNGEWAEEASWALSTSSGEIQTDGKTGEPIEASFTSSDEEQIDGFCIPSGSYYLRLYDSYGDGWNGGELKISNVAGKNLYVYTLSDADGSSGFELVSFGTGGTSIEREGDEANCYLQIKSIENNASYDSFDIMYTEVSVRINTLNVNYYDETDPFNPWELFGILGGFWSYVSILFGLIFVNEQNLQLRMGNAWQKICFCLAAKEDEIKMTKVTPMNR